MSKVFCPYCGSSKTHRTYYGWGESIVKDTTTYAIGYSIGAAAHAIPFVGESIGHGILHETKKISKSNSCEYECESCHKTFGYSSGYGSKKR